VAGAALTAIAALAIAACGKAAPDSSTSQSTAAPSASNTLKPTTPAPTGEAGKVTWATYRDVGTIDPIQAFDCPENTAITTLCDSLQRQAPDGTIGPGLATLTHPNDTTLVITLKQPDLLARRRAVADAHACGDRGVREALNAYRSAGAAPGIRHRIEHIETIQPDDLPRFAAEGVIASMQPQHMMWLEPDRSDNWSRRLGGGERCDRAFRARDLLESGATVTLGSDWPVARYDWREGMAAAQLRRPPGFTDRAPYDDQAVDALTALHGYTTQPALTVGDQARLGRVAPGFLADITVLAEDPVTCPPDDLIADPVVLTVVGGEVVFRGGAIDG